jgi:hypothetical protein
MGWSVLFIIACVFCDLIVLQYCGFVCPATVSSLMRTIAGGISNVVDVYNVATGAWSAAQLSVARYNLAAASVGNVALFAGGVTGTLPTNSALLCWEGDFGGICILLRACFALAAILRLYLPCDRFLSHARHCRCCCF